jgi:hypothetical protein
VIVGVRVGVALPVIVGVRVGDGEGVMDGVTVRVDVGVTEMVGVGVGVHGGAIKVRDEGQSLPPHLFGDVTFTVMV